MASSPDLMRIEFDCEVSGRMAIISDEGDSVWLYLTTVDTLDIEEDCWLFNKPSAPAEPEVERYRSQSVPPPAPARFVLEGGMRDCPQEEAFSVRWSADGKAVMVALGGLDIGIAAAGAQAGISRHLKESGPWGRPWDEAAVAALEFPQTAADPGTSG